jgi:hypothetical protein
MKIKDIALWPSRWVSPTGFQEEDAPVGNGILIDFRFWEGGSNITLVVQCPEGKYYASLKTKQPVSPDLIRFLHKNKGRRLKEILRADLEPFPISH